MSCLSFAPLPLLAAALAFNSFSQSITGQWTRSQGGAVIDVLDLAPKNGGFSITLREAPGRSPYASGFCTAVCDRTPCSVRNSAGKTGLVELTPSATALHYRSIYDDGASVWQGDFVRSQESRQRTASQWTRTEAGRIVDVLDLAPDGDGYKITLREGFAKPAYSTGTCTVEGDIVTCAARTASGLTGQIVLTLRASSLHYRSSYESGKRIWEGEFARAASIQ